MRWKPLLITLGSLLVVCSACASPPQAGPTTAISVLPPITRYSVTTRIQPGRTAPVSVSCPSGNQMLGGGFSSYDLFEYAAWIEGSYPSGQTTWTVVGAAPASFFDLEADVYCTPAQMSLDIQNVQATGSDTMSITCPQGTVLLSGGFHSTRVVDESHPQSNGWLSATPDARIQVYARCAASHVRRSQVVSSTFNAHSSSHSYAPGDQAVACPAGQIATGGGFAGADLIVGSQTNGSAFTGWSITAGGDADVKIFAQCVQFQG